MPIFHLINSSFSIAPWTITVNRVWYAINKFQYKLQIKKLLLGNELFKFLALFDLTQTRKLSDCSAVYFLVFCQNFYILPTLSFKVPCDRYLKQSGSAKINFLSPNVDNYFFIKSVMTKQVQQLLQGLERGRQILFQKLTNVRFRSALMMPWPVHKTNHFLYLNLT